MTRLRRAGDFRTQETQTEIFRGDSPVEEDSGFYFFGMIFHWIENYKIFWVGFTLGILGTLAHFRHFYREVFGAGSSRRRVMMTASSPLSL